MRKKAVVHPIDLQDREGFLSFLTDQAKGGYEAVRIYRTVTLFRQTETPPQCYSMGFWPEGRPQPEPAPRIPGLRNDVGIYPAPGDPAWGADWAETVAKHYTSFVPYRPAGVLSTILRQLGLPLVLAGLLLMGGGQLAGLDPAFGDLTRLMPMVLLWIILAGVIVATSVLEHWVDTLHLRGLRAAWAKGQPYESPASLRPLVRVKNGLLLISPLPSLVLLVSLLLCWNG